MNVIRFRFLRWIVWCALSFGCFLHPASSRLYNPSAASKSASVSSSDATPPNPAYFDAIWVGGTNGLAKVSANDGSLLFSDRSIGDVRAIAVDDVHNLVWAFSAGHLRTYDFEGFSGISVPVPPRPPLIPSIPENPLPESLVDADDLEDVYCKANGVIPNNVSPNALWPLAKLAASPLDGSVWLGLGDHLLQIASDGAILVDVKTPGLITGLSVDPDNFRVWVSTCGATHSYELDGTASRRITLGDLTAWQKDVAFDPVHKHFWVGLRGLLASTGEIRRFSESGRQQARGIPFSVQHLATDHHGLVWASSDSTLLYAKTIGGRIAAQKTFTPFANDSDLVRGACVGLDLITANPPSHKDCTIVALRAHPKSRYAVAAIPQIIRLVNTYGGLIRRIPLTRIGGTKEDKIRSLGVSTDIVPPSIDIISPRDDVFPGISANPCYFGDGTRGSFCVDVIYSDVGVGVDAGTMTLSIDGEEYDTSRCDFTSESAQCLVVHDDGPVSVSVSIADHAGNVSATTQFDFILDNFSPGVLFDSDYPPTNNPQLNISGSISELGSLTLNGEPVNLTSARRFSIRPYPLTEGENYFDFVVTDTASNVVPQQLVVVLDTTPPEITVSNPTDGFLTSTGFVVVTGSINESAQLDINGSQAAVDENNEFVSETVDLAEGLNTIQLTATDNAGNIRIDFITGTLDTVAPTIPVEGTITRTGAGGQVTVAGAAGSVEGGSTVTVANITSGSRATVIANADGSFSTGLAGSKSDAFQVRATDAAGNESEAASLAGGPFSGPITINITSPAHNSTVLGDFVLVGVDVQAPPNTGVTINGVIAAPVQEATGMRFYANVPVEIGDNAITAKATAQDGRVVTDTVNIGSMGPLPYRISFAPDVNAAPARLMFSVENQQDRGIRRISVDFESDGIPDFETSNPSAPITHTYTEAGLVNAIFTITGSFGAPRTQTVRFVVQDPAAVDLAIQAIWSGMNAALAAGDSDTALSFMSAKAQTLYAPVFSALLQQMPQIVGSYSELQRSDITGSYAEYGVNRIIDNVDRVFLIGFILDADGQWRISSM